MASKNQNVFVNIQEVHDTVCLTPTIGTVAVLATHARNVKSRIYQTGATSLML